MQPEGVNIHPDLADIASLNRHHSFIRPMSTSRFNQKRRGEDSEQVLIAMGSVLVFDLKHPVADDVLLDIHQNGIGANQQQGLGWVYVNPSWAQQVTLPSAELFKSITLIDDKHNQPQSDKTTDTVLLSWLKERVSFEALNNQDQIDVKKVLKTIVDHYSMFNSALRDVGAHASRFGDEFFVLRINAKPAARAQPTGHWQTWIQGDRLIRLRFACSIYSLSGS